MCCFKPPDEFGKQTWQIVGGNFSTCVERHQDDLTLRYSRVFKSCLFTSKLDATNFLFSVSIYRSHRNLKFRFVLLLVGRKQFVKTYLLIIKRQSKVATQSEETALAEGQPPETFESSTEQLACIRSWISSPDLAQKQSNWVAKSTMMSTCDNQ